MFLGWVLRSEFLKFLVFLWWWFFWVVAMGFIFGACVDFNWGVVAGF